MLVATFALALALLTQAAAVPLPGAGSDPRSTVTTAAEQVARAAQQLHGDATIAAALNAVKVGTDASDGGAEQALAVLGFETALDLRLLAGGPEAAELMASLSTSGELSIADRAKVRLLVGDRTHLARVATLPAPSEDVAPDRDQGEQAAGLGQHRQLQDGAADRGTLSADTIAIVFSVCVGVCGYLLQAWTSDRASRHAGELQREHDAQARILAVEQDRTQAQIRRTERWVGDCCMPISRALNEYFQARMRFVVACAKKVEATQPAAFAELYDKDYSMKNLNVNADGSVSVDGYDPTNIDMKGLTWGATCNYLSFLTGASAALVDVWRQDVIAILAKYAYIRELPQAFLDLMAADLDGPLAADYRVYIRHEVKPVLDRIKAIMHAHYAAIEAPSSEWLVETFPGHSSRQSPNQIVDNVVNYARAWDGVLAEWDAGRLDVLFPSGHMMPWLAMLKLNTWSKQRGETKQHELIGMSSGRKDASAKALAAFEIEPASE